MKEQAKDFLVITGGTAIVAAAVFFFLVPSHVSVGSISGLAVVLENFIPLPISAITMILNVALLIVGFCLSAGNLVEKRCIRHSYCR